MILHITRNDHFHGTVLFRTGWLFNPPCFPLQHFTEPKVFKRCERFKKQCCLSVAHSCSQLAHPLPCILIKQSCERYEELRRDVSSSSLSWHGCTAQWHAALQSWVTPVTVNCRLVQSTQKPYLSKRKDTVLENYSGKSKSCLLEYNSSKSLQVAGNCCI